MIQANELRIGNWIYNVYSKFIQVENIQQTSFNFKIDGDGVCGSYSLEYYSGIPLTPEILEKWFDGIDDDGLYAPADDYDFFRLQHRYLMDDGFGVIINKKDTGVVVNTVHQLQNLYWCLVGKELNVTL